MTRLYRRLAHAPELLDAPQHDPAELARSLDQVAEVNRLLGGRRALLSGLEILLDTPAASGHDVLRVLDVGTGSADLPLAVARWAEQTGRGIRITATDVHPQMRALARERTRGCGMIEIGAADALALPYKDAGFDVVLLSLTLHHFEYEEQLQALREAARVARVGIIVNELERNRANYWGARLLALTRWRGNRLTRHDGPLSVLRAFTRAELAALTREAGLELLRLERRFFYRLLLVARSSR